MTLHAVGVHTVTENPAETTFNQQNSMKVSAQVFGPPHTTSGIPPQECRPSLGGNVGRRRGTFYAGEPG